MARLGNTLGLMKPSLRPSSRVSSAPRPTSLPVPAVVGMAITGATAGVIFATPPWIKAYCSSGGAWVASRATPLPRSMDEPPPKATTPSHPASL